MGRGIPDSFLRGAGDIVSLEGHAGIKARIRQALMTKSGNQRGAGEIPWRMELGSQILGLLHVAASRRREEAANALALNAIQRVDGIESIQINSIFEDKGLTIRIEYRISADGTIGVVSTTLPEVG